MPQDPDEIVHRMRHIVAVVEDETVAPDARVPVGVLDREHFPFGHCRTSRIGAHRPCPRSYRLRPRPNTGVVRHLLVRLERHAVGIDLIEKHLVRTRRIGRHIELVASRLVAQRRAGIFHDQRQELLHPARRDTEGDDDGKWHGGGSFRVTALPPTIARPAVTRLSGI